ncbi:hypothetical protein [Flavobacterium sp. JP2137]|uniref:hypothetical protein n=1 Tax=Flavobacterium sp. JP2137 TaxID=3414510 RepID=UPI003D2FD999
MKHILLLSLFLCFQLPAVAQDHIIQVAPRCGQQAPLTTAFSSLGLKQGAVYFLHFRPAACPRCESSIWATAALLKNLNKEVVLVVAGEDRVRNEAYIEGIPGIQFDDFALIVYDTEDFYPSLIDYQATFNLAYPLLYKIDREQGLFYSINTLAGAAISSEWIESIIQNNALQACKEVAAIKKENSTVTNAFWDDSRTLNAPNLVNPRSLNANTSYIYLTDATTNAVLIYDLHGQLIQEYFPEPEELYIDVKDDEEYRKKIKKDFVDTGIARVIYLDAYVDERANTRIPASVPDIWYEGKASYYANSTLFIEKESGANSVKNIIRFETDVQFNDTLPPSPFFVSHSYYQPFFDDYFAFPLYKGWPTRGYQLDQSDFNNNPFDPKFYRDSPVLRVYKHNDEFVDIGNLPIALKKNQLGYYYKVSFYTATANRLYLFDKYLGEVQIFDKKSIESKQNRYEVVQLFPEKLRQLDDFTPVVDEQETKMNLITAYNPIVTQSAVWHAKVDADQNICLLIMDSKNHQLLFQKHNSKMDRLLVEKKFPISNEEAIISATIQFDANNRANRIVGMEKLAGSFYLKWKNL